MILTYWNRYQDTGLFLVRVGLGIMFILHGLPKLTGGVEAWTKIGSAMGFIGVSAYPAFWGLMAGLAEFGGGILLIAGFLFRPACLALAFTMFVATVYHVNTGDGFNKFSHAMEDGIVFLGLFIIGPGKYAIDQKFVIHRTS
ncbi:DoxX family protein [Leptospira sp. GIMC2001]|uniref:DoxX family protein n=1 Tax=Leptospira sp. GIMC2001 TaxID=1513297 RepID=UPI00234A7816|nr:DoxX family protein [Leptospira sp. GIMC2001]WCL49195.1 DoxX family protein [Leptospira sp. GIMC2001]